MLKCKMNTVEDNNSKSSHIFLDAVVKLSGVAASMALLLSVIYDFGFFKSLDITFSDVPTSISDHFRSGLIWFPVLFFGVVGATIFELITVRIEGGMSEDEIISSSPNPKKTRKFREAPIKLMPWLAGLIIFSYVLMGDTFIYGLPIAFCLLWFWIAPWINNHPRIFKRRPKYIRAIIFWMPVIIIFLYGKGYTDGKRLIHLNKSNCNIIFNSLPDKEEPIISLKLLEKGLLFKKSNDSRVSFEKWDNIQRIDKKVDHSSYPGVVLKMLGISLPIKKQDSK